MMADKALRFLLFGEDRTASASLHKLDGEAGKSADRIGGSFKKVGEHLAEAFAGAEVLEFFKGAGEAAEVAEKASRQTEAVLKSTGGAANVTAGDVDGLARSISAKVGIDHVAIQSGENLLLTFQNVRNEAGKGNDVFNRATQTATDMSVALGVTLTGATRLVGRALNDPVKGLAALTRVGVTFTAGQTKQIKSMVASGHAMNAQKLILAQLNAKFAGSAEAQATPAMKAKVAWTDFKETIGKLVLPIADKLFTVFSNDIAPALQHVAGWVHNNTGLLKTLGLALSPLLAAWGAYAAYTKVAAIATGVWSAVTSIGAGVMALFGASAAAATEETVALDAAMDANPIGLVVAAIALLAAGLVIAWKKSETFRAIVKGAFSAVKTIAVDIGHFFTKDIPHAFQAVVGALHHTWNDVVSFMKKWGPIALAVLAPFIGIPLLIWQHFSKIKDFMDRIPGFILGILGKVGGAAGKIGGAIWKGIKAGVSQVADLGKMMYNAIAGTLDRDLIDPIKNWKFTIGAFGIHHTFQPFGGIPDIPLLANGGVVTKPTLVMAGEAGPEAIIPLAHAQRYGVGRNGGGDTYNITLGVMGDAKSAARVLLAELQRLKGSGVRVNLA